MGTNDGVRLRYVGRYDVYGNDEAFTTSGAPSPLYVPPPVPRPKRKRLVIALLTVGIWAWWWAEFDLNWEGAHWYTYFAAVNIACLGILAYYALKT